METLNFADFGEGSLTTNSDSWVRSSFRLYRCGSQDSSASRDCQQQIPCVVHFDEVKPIRLAVIGLCLPLLACYEEPVRDHLHLVFSPGPAIVVTAVRDIASPAAAGDNSAVEERTDEARIDLVTGLD